jgi:hypothetical protein
VTTPDVSWPRTAGALTLRPPTRESIDDILTWRNRPEVTRWLLRTTVDPDAFRAAWLGVVDDPRDHSAVAELVMERLGMRREQHGVRDSWHAELGWIDGCTYGILAEEWRSQAARRRDARPAPRAP